MKRMKKWASALLALLLYASLSAPAALAVSAVYREATKDTKLYSGAGTSFSTVASVPKGDVVVVKNWLYSEWWKVSYTNAKNQTYEGYMNPANLKETTKKSNEKKNTAPLGCYSTTKTLNLRSKASASSKIRTTVPKGQVVNVTETTDPSWFKCTYINKKGKKYKNAYLAASGLKKAAEPYNVKSKTELRSKASKSGKNLQTLPKGSYLFVTASVDSKWFKVNYTSFEGKLMTGYVLKRKVKQGTVTNKPYKQVDPEAEAKKIAEQWRTKKRYQLTAKTKMTKTASTKGKKVAVINKNGVVAVVGTSGKFYKVIYNGSKNVKQVGYLPKNKLKEYKDPKAGEYVTTVKTQLRAKDESSAAVTAELDKYILINVLDSFEKSWYRVKYTGADGKAQIGFVSKSHAKQYVEKNEGVYYTKVSTPLRKSAGETAEALKELSEGVRVRVKKTYNPDWYYVIYTDANDKSFSGFVDANHLAKFQDQRLEYVTSAETSIYRQPGKGTLGSLGAGVRVVVRDTALSEWYWASAQDSTGKQQTGFVSAKDVMTKEEAQTQQEAQEAQTQQEAA